MSTSGLVKVAAVAVVDDDGRETLDLEPPDRLGAEVLVGHDLELPDESREHGAGAAEGAEVGRLVPAEGVLDGLGPHALAEIVPLSPSARSLGVNLSMRPPVIGPIEPTTWPGRAGDGPV